MSIALTIRPMIAPPHPPHTSPLRFAASRRGFDNVSCILCICDFFGEDDGWPGRDICGIDGPSSAPPMLMEGTPSSSPKDIRGMLGDEAPPRDSPGPDMLMTGPSSSSLSPSALAGKDIFGIRGVV